MSAQLAKQLPGLRELQVSDNALRDAGAAILAAALPATALVTLTLVDNDITSLGSEAILRAAAESKLESLEISGIMPWRHACIV
jgi:hypothetical protein